MQYQEQVQSTCVQFRVIFAFQHVEEILGQGQAALSITDVNRASQLLVTQDCISVRYDRRELRDELYALPHEVVPRIIVGIVVVRVEFQHAPRKNIHDVRAFQIHDVQNSLLLQWHILEYQLFEVIQLFMVGKTSGKEQKGYLLEPEPVFFDESPHEISDFISTEKQFPLYRHKAAIGSAIVAHHISDVREADENAGAIFVTQPSLHVEFLEKLSVYLRALFHFIGELEYEILFLLEFHSSEIKRSVNSFVPRALPSGMRRARSAVA